MLVPSESPTPPSEAPSPASRREAIGLGAEEILASITDAFMALDAEWRFAFVNEQAEQILGRSRDELLGKVVWDEYPGLDETPFGVSYRLAVETREPVHFDAYYEPFDRHFAARAYPFAGGLSVYVADVTEARRTEASLRQSEAQFRQLSDSLPQLVWTTTPEGYHDYFNDHWYAYTGMPRPDEPGGENDGVAQGFRWADYLHPDDVERTAAAWGRSLATGDPYEIEYRFRRAADGAYRWFIARANALRGADGEILRWFGTCTDIHDQKQAEASLRESRARLELALEGGEIGSWEWDIETDALSYDSRAAELWGLGERTVETADAFMALVHPDDVPGLRQALAAAVDGSERYTAEFRLLEPGGRIRWMAGRGTVVEAGGRRRLYGLNFDVTERREQEEALRQKNAEMERFAYTVSHDLKSPLVTVTGFLGLLKAHLAAGRTEKAAAAAERALGGAERMGRLIEDLLLLSRAGRTVGDPEPVDLDEVGERLAADLALRVSATGGRLEVEGPLGTVLADRRRVDEALENLMANAVRYGLGGGGSRVVLRAEATRGGSLRVIVEDDGPGVPQAYRQRIFELFQRLDGGGDGTGVGLAVVARVMEVLGGRAWVEPAGGPEGREGARFVLLFPPQAVAQLPAAEAA